MVIGFSQAEGMFEDSFDTHFETSKIGQLFELALASGETADSRDDRSSAPT